MATAAQMDITLDQGADWSCQLYWTRGDNRPYFLVAPMRMEIRDQVNNVAVTLQTNDSSTDDGDADPDDRTILFNSETGLVQLELSDEQTDRLSPQNSYVYDLFVHHADETGTVRKKRLVYGQVFVNGRITRNG